MIQKQHESINNTIENLQNAVTELSGKVAALEQQLSEKDDAPKNQKTIIEPTELQVLLIEIANIIWVGVVSFNLPNLPKHERLFAIQTFIQ